MGKLSGGGAAPRGHPRPCELLQQWGQLDSGLSSPSPTFYAEVTKPQAQSSTHALSSKRGRCLPRPQARSARHRRGPDGVLRRFLCLHLFISQCPDTRASFSLRSMISVHSINTFTKRFTALVSRHSIVRYLGKQAFPPTPKYKYFLDKQRIKDLQEV